MRLLGLEIKRLWMSRMTQSALALAALLALALACIPVTYVYCMDPDGEGGFLTGFAAIRQEKAVTAEICGKITQEEIRTAIETYQNCLRKYGVSETCELPEGAWREIEPVSPLLHVIREAYASEQGIAADLMALDTAELPDFYGACRGHLRVYMNLEQSQHPAAREKAREMYGAVETPFYFSSGVTSDAMEYEGLLLFCLLLCCCVVCAPVFSSEYQTGADSILRCTKYGRTRLAAVRIASALLLVLSMAAVSLTVWIACTALFFGAESLRTSVQIIASAITLLPMNMGQLLVCHGAFGMLMLAAGACFALLLSSRLNSNVQAMAASLLGCMLPVILYWVLPAAVMNVAKCLFPTGGIGLNNGILYDLLDLRFLNLGDHAVWTPWLTAAFALAEIPLMIRATVRGYLKHAD